METSRLTCNHSQIASEYDQKYKDTLGQLEKDIRDNIDFIGLRKGGRVLDYACGTGLLSRVGDIPSWRRHHLLTCWF